MIHGLSNFYLYSAKKILAKWSNGSNTVQIQGTGFFVIKDEDTFFITNRHVVEPGYNDPQYKDYNVIEFVIESYGSFDGSNLPQNLRAATVGNWKDFKFHSNSNNDIACLKNVLIVGEKFSVNSGIEYETLATDEWISQISLYVIR